jgi:hypothetical protein
MKRAQPDRHVSQCRPKTQTCHGRQAAAVGPVGIDVRVVDRYLQAYCAARAHCDGQCRHHLIPYGGAWEGPIFVLTHHPEDARQSEGVTILSCPVDEAVRIALEAAGGKNIEVFSPNIGRQLLELGLIDEIDLHIAPVLLGAGIRLYDNPGHQPIRLHRVGDDGPTSAVDVRYRPGTT